MIKRIKKIVQAIRGKIILFLAGKDLRVCINIKITKKTGITLEGDNYCVLKNIEVSGLNTGITIQGEV